MRDTIHFEGDRRRGSSGKSQFGGEGSATPEVGRAGGHNLYRAARGAEARVGAARFESLRIDAPDRIEGVGRKIVAGGRRDFRYRHFDRVADANSLRAGQNELRHSGRDPDDAKRRGVRSARREVQCQAPARRALWHGHGGVETPHRDRRSISQVQPKG